MSGLVDAIRAFSTNSSPLDFWLVFQNWGLFWTGLQNTLILLVVSLTVGGVIAVPLAIVRATRAPVLNPLAYGFIYLIRGTPLLVQLYIIYYGLGQFEAVRNSPAWMVLKDPWWCALIAFSISTSAYTAEIFRAAIVDTPRGEVEAAIAAGMSGGLAVIAKKVVHTQPWCEAADAGVWSGEVVGVGPRPDGRASLV